MVSIYVSDTMTQTETGKQSRVEPYVNNFRAQIITKTSPNNAF